MRKPVKKITAVLLAAVLAVSSPVTSFFEKGYSAGKKISRDELLFDGVTYKLNREITMDEYGEIYRRYVAGEKIYDILYNMGLISKSDRDSYVGMVEEYDSDETYNGYGEGTEVWHWYIPKSTDDIPKDTTFRLLMIDKCDSYSFKNLASDLHQIGGGDNVYRYISTKDMRANGSQNLYSRDNHLNCAVASAEMMDIVQYDKDEFYSIEDFDTPYARVITEDDPGSGRSVDGLTGHLEKDEVFTQYMSQVNEELEKSDYSSDKYLKELFTTGRHYSRNKEGADVLSPLIRISKEDDFRENKCFYLEPHYLESHKQYKVWGLISDDYYYLWMRRVYESFSQWKYTKDRPGATDIFELTVNPNPKRTTGLLYNVGKSDQSAYIQVPYDLRRVDGYDTYEKKDVWQYSSTDCTLTFEYYNSFMHYIEINTSLNKPKYYQTDYDGYRKLDFWYVGDSGGESDWWYFNKDTLTVREKTEEKWVDPQFWVNSLNFNGATDANVHVIHSDEDGKAIRVAPRIYIGVKDGSSKITGNGSKYGNYSAYYYVKDGKIENIQNITLIPRGMHMVVEKDAVLIVGGWLVVEGELEVKGTMIIDSGGLVSYLGSETLKVNAKDALNYSNNYGTIELLGGSNTIVLKGGRLVPAKYKQYDDSSIINYGFVGLGIPTLTSMTSGAVFEARRGSSTYRGVYKVKDFSNMWISKDKNTDSGTGIPCTSYDLLGSSIPMSKVEGKIVVSDMANTFYFGRTTDSNNMVVDVKYETYYEK